LLIDLRESGQLEQDADVVAFIWGELKEGRGNVKLTFSKGRNMTLGEVDLYFNGDTMTYKPLTRNCNV